MTRHGRLADFAVSNLLRQRGRTTVVVIVYALLVALVASLLLFVRALRSEARLLLRDAPAIVVQRLVGGRHELIPVARAAAIGADPRRRRGHARGSGATPTIRPPASP